MPFRPTDFTQVNHADQPRAGGARAAPARRRGRDERVIDWFCGLGNFTLPLATRAREVLGIEGSDDAGRARRATNARAQRRRRAKTRFVARNLFEIDAGDLAAYGRADKWLVDPPREGAFALAKALADLHAATPALAPAGAPPQRIVYVSCNPATLARDAGLLVHQAGYRCSAAGVVNMFPHTAHVESIAVFDRAPRRRALTESVAVPLWLFVVLVALALFAALEWFLLPGVRWYFRRKVRRVMDEISTRFKIELPEFKLTRRRALLDRLTSDPRVLARGRSSTSPRAASRATS